MKHRDFRLVWLGSIFSGSALWIQQTTLGWLTYDLTGSPFLLGAVNGMRSVPLLLLGPVGGVAADRVDRKRLMLSTQLWQVVLTAAFATLIVTGHLAVWQLFVFTLLFGVGWAFNMPVRQSVVPNLVPRIDLMNAVALNSAGFNASRILGPAVAGLMIATIGPGENFYIQAAAYSVVAVLVILLRIPAAARARRASVHSNLREGVAFVLKHPVLRLQMCLALVPVMIGMPYTTLLPIFASDVLGVGPEGFGLMMSAPGFGAVIGTLTLASLRSVERKGLLVLGGVFCLGVFLVCLSLSRLFPLTLFVLMLLGAVQMVFLTTNQTLIQLTTPDQLRGRVMGVYMLEQGLQPLGSLLAGSIANLTDAPMAVLLMGLTTSAIAALFAFGARGLRQA